MKKRCQYCGTIVKCDITIVDKEKGYGVYCDVCGSFIKITRQIYRNVGLNSSYSKISYKRKIKNRRIVAGIILAIILIPICYFFYSPMPNVFNMQEERTYSVFVLYDNKTRIDVSDSVEMSILFPKKDSIFENIDDINNISKFEISLIAKASDIQIDLRDVLYVWIQIDPLNKTMYQSECGLFVGGCNYQFCFYVCIYDVPIVESGFCRILKP